MEQSIALFLHILIYSIHNSSCQDFRLSGLETAEEERQIRRDKYYNDALLVFFGVFIMLSVFNLLKAFVSQRKKRQVMTIDIESADYVPRKRIKGMIYIDKERPQIPIKGINDIHPKIRKAETEKKREEFLAKLTPEELEELKIRVMRKNMAAL